MRLNLFLYTLLVLFLIGCSDQSIVEPGTDDALQITAATGSARGHVSTPKLLSSGAVVEVPANSVDALADAIAEAGHRGVVLLKSGDHHESQTVEINSEVAIIGESGARLIADTQPTPVEGKVNPALYIHNTSHVLVRGLTILPKGAIGGTAIFTENAPNTTLEYNSIQAHEFGIIIQAGDRTKINNNTVVGSSGWLTGEVPVVDGIVIINGEFSDVRNNKVSNTLLGIFASDRKGLLTENETYGNFIGVILCTVPNAIPGPSGEIFGSEVSANRWIARGNYSHDNFDIGFLVIDGANGNLLVNNRGGNNGRYDIELAGDSERFGFFTPTSFDNKVNTGQFGDLIIKDCGLNSEVNGGIAVDTEADPCS